MNEQQNNQGKRPTQVFNVIILDKSGSMSSIRDAAIDGFNETLAGIQAAQEQYANTQQHYVSLVTFCSHGTEKVFDKAPVAEVCRLTREDYRPCCTTPLYDAMGFTLTDMQEYVRRIDDSAVVVTIITDGLENASREYSGKDVKALVDQLKGNGWSFTYMGANQDAVEVAQSLHIRNARNFDYSNEGTRCSMAKDRSTRMKFFQKLHDFREDDTVECMPAPQRAERYSAMADEAFDEEA